MHKTLVVVVVSLVFVLGVLALTGCPPKSGGEVDAVPKGMQPTDANPPVVNEPADEATDNAVEEPGDEALDETGDEALDESGDDSAAMDEPADEASDDAAAPVEEETTE